MINQQAMTELKELLFREFPGDIEKVILFGSQVSGEAKEYSDYDILIILKRSYDWRYRDKVYDATWEIDFKHDILTDIKLISNDELHTLKGKQPFVQDAFKYGMPL